MNPIPPMVNSKDENEYPKAARGGKPWGSCINGHVFTAAFSANCPPELKAMTRQPRDEASSTAANVSSVFPEYDEAIICVRPAAKRGKV